jgi:hypothetical protein
MVNPVLEEMPARHFIDNVKSKRLNPLRFLNQ